MGLFDSIKNAFGKAVTEAQEAGQTLAEKAGQAPRKLRLAGKDG